jgi:hypothetical protein
VPFENRVNLPAHRERRYRVRVISQFCLVGNERSLILLASIIQISDGELDLRSAWLELERLLILLNRLGVFSSGGMMFRAKLKRKRRVEFKAGEGLECSK